MKIYEDNITYLLQNIETDNIVPLHITKHTVVSVTWGNFG